MRTAMLLTATLSLMGSGTVARAAEPAPDPAAALGQCMTMKSTGEDRIALARWFITSIGSAPQVRAVVTVAPDAKDQQDRAVAALFTRLLTDTCLAEARGVARTSGSAGFRVAGEALGRIAMQELLSNQEANAAMGSFSRYVSDAEFAKLKEPTP